MNKKSIKLVFPILISKITFVYMFYVFPPPVHIADEGFVLKIYRFIFLSSFQFQSIFISNILSFIIFSADNLITIFHTENESLKT